MARKVLNSPAYAKPCVVDVAHKLLRPTNWVFLDGRAHVDFRKGLNGLFTRSALELYLPGQEEVYDKYFKRFVEISRASGGRPVPFMPVFRELNCAVSCRTFVGHYMSDATVKKIADDYFRITAALELVNFPIILPFTKTWYGKKAADMVLDEFAKCAAKSKVRMRAGGEVTCIMDGWIKSMVESEEYRQRVAERGADEAGPKPANLLRDFTDLEISQTIFTFLFASQDASSSATTWLFQLMANRPEMLRQLRDENLRVRDGDRDRPLSMDMLEGMKYTRAVVKETLRYRPPVLMVPYLVKKTFPVTDTYTAPKGGLFPSSTEKTFLRAPGYSPRDADPPSPRLFWGYVCRFDDRADALSGPARPRGLSRTRDVQAGSMDQRRGRKGHQELARLRHRPALLPGPDVRAAAPDGHDRQGVLASRLGAPCDADLGEDQGLCHHLSSGEFFLDLTRWMKPFRIIIIHMVMCFFVFFRPISFYLQHQTYFLRESRANDALHDE